jgi:hypothetical protein
MSKVQDALRPFWLNGLNEVSFHTRRSRPRKRSFKEWLNDESYVVSVIDRRSGRLEIDILNTPDTVSALANDIDRFGSATLETVAGIRTDGEIPQSRAWPLIRCYYAAFYAAHGLCRVFGRSITSLDHDQADALRRTARASGLEPGEVNAISEKMYVFEVDLANRRVSGQRLERGSHEDTWRQFEKLLLTLEAKVLGGPAGTAVKQEIFDLLRTIREILNSDQSAGNWLSKIRNNVNYRHDYGAWYPHGTGVHWANVETIFRSFLRNPLIGQAALEPKIIVRFTKGCALIVALFHEVLRDLADRHPTNKSFLHEKTIPVLERAEKILNVV